MSQKDLADCLYVDQSTVSRWERGIRFPDTELIEKMAIRFGVDASVLFDAPMSRAELPQILVVEDEPILLQDSCDTISATLGGAAVLPCRWASEALALAKTQRVDIAFLDIELVGGNGLDLARGLLQYHPRCNVIFLTSHPEYAREAPVGPVCDSFAEAGHGHLPDKHGREIAYCSSHKTMFSLT